MENLPIEIIVKFINAARLGVYMLKYFYDKGYKVQPDAIECTLNKHYHKLNN